MAKKGCKRYNRKQAVAEAGQLYAGGSNLQEIMKIMDRSESTVRRYLQEAQAMVKFSEQSAEDFKTTLLERLETLKDRAETFWQEGERAKDNVTKGIAFDKALAVIRTTVDLLSKCGTFEGGKASVTVNILNMKEDDAYSVVERAIENPGFAQALCNLLDAKGYVPDIEGEVEVLE
jgi:hypothetical protein